MTDIDIKRISSYLDNELSQSQRIEFEKDLASDNTLQNELNTYKRFSNQLIITREDQKVSERIKTAVLMKRKKWLWHKRISYVFMPIAGLALIFVVINLSTLKANKIITNDDILNEYSIALMDFAE